MIDAAGHERRVGEEQVENGSRDAEPHVLEVQPADRDHPRHDRQLRKDRHHAGGGLVEHAAVGLGGLLPFGARVGGEDPLRGDLRQQEEQGIAGAEAGELVGIDLGITGLESGRRRGAGEVVALRPRGDHVGQEKHEQRDAEKREPAAGEIRFEQRPPHHQRIEEHPQEQCPRHREDPDEAHLLDRRARLVAAILDGQEARG